MRSLLELLSEVDERQLAEVLYKARLREAWGSHWESKDRWPADAEAWRQYPHQPNAGVDLALAEARAAVAWLRARA